MPRFSTHDQEQLRDIKDQLATLTTDVESSTSTWLGQLCGLLGLEKGLSYQVRRNEDESFAVDQAVTALVPTYRAKQRIVEELDGVLRAARNRWSVFDAARPEPGQRNRAVAVLPRRLAEQLDESVAAFKRVRTQVPPEILASQAAVSRMVEMLPRVGLADHWQLRALVCKGDSLLGWVGGFRREQPTKREERLFSNLIPDLRRRLLIEQLLGRAPMLEATLDAALEQIPRAAFVVSEIGSVLVGNSVARDRLERSPNQTRIDLAAALRARGCSDDFEITPIASRGRAPVYLLVGRREAGISEKLAAVALRWALTARQREVLGLVVHGDTNRIIANKLRCAERTIELHLTALFDTAGVESRAALISRFFTS